MIERYPDAAAAALADGHEIGHHGYLHEHPNELTAEQERYWFQRALDVLEDFTGTRTKGSDCVSPPRSSSAASSPFQ